MNTQRPTDPDLFARAERWLWRIVVAAIVALGLVVLLALPVPVHP